MRIKEILQTIEALAPFHSGRFRQLRTAGGRHEPGGNCSPAQP